MSERFGRTWWGQRLLEIVGRRLDLFGPTAQRGREDALKGRVGELDVDTGRVAARVHQGPTRSVMARLEVDPLDDAEWQETFELLASRLSVTANLADGRMPDDIEPLLRPNGISIFPDTVRLEPQESGDPDRSAMALVFTLVAAFDSDPFVLFRLRGRDRRSVLAHLRARRAGVTEAREVERVVSAPASVDGPTTDFYDLRDDLEDIPVHPVQTEDPGHLLEQLGDPPGFDDPQPMVALIDRAAATGWKIAAGEGAGAADLELLLAELRAQRMATADDLAEALGWDVERTRDALDKMFEEGTVLRTGKGDKTRYRA